jgi:2-dehydropantoate 2-reductase
MDEPILVVGPGAIGLALAAGLRRSGARVALLARTASAEKRLVASGFEAVEPDGSSRRVSGGLLSARALKAPARAAFFCVKSGDAARAAAAARGMIAADAPVIALQNGIGHERIFRRKFGPRRAVIGVCYFAADRPAPGVLRLNGGEDVLLARHDGNAEALAAAAALVEAAGFRAHIKDSEDGMLWTKAAFNAAVNPLGAACGVESGRLAEDPALRELAMKALAEAAAAAEAAGHRLDYSDMAEKLLTSARNAPHQRNSMLQDLAAGRRTEATVILGPLIAAAKRAKTPVPTLELLSSVIARLEKAR